MTLPFSVPADPHMFTVSADVLECIAELMDAADDREHQENILESHTARWHACHVDLLVGMMVTNLSAHNVSADRVHKVAAKWRRHGSSDCN